MGNKRNQIGEPINPLFALKHLTVALLVLITLSCAKGSTSQNEKTEAWANELAGTVSYDFRTFSITNPDAKGIASIMLNSRNVQDEDLRELADIGPILYSLVVPDTGVTDKGVMYLSKIKSLQYLSLDATKITDAGLVHLNNLKNLISLDISRNQITDGGIGSLQDLTKLRALALDQTSIDGKGLIVFAKNGAPLQELTLNGTAVTDNSIELLSGFKHLTHLSLAKTNVGDTGIAALRELTSLKRLELDFTQITDQGIEQLAGLRQLEVLTLQDTGLTDAAVAVLEKMKALKFLTLVGTKISKDGINRLKTALPMTEITYIDEQAV